MATAISLVVVVLILAMWGYQAWSSHREKARNAPLENPRDWSKIKGVDSSELSLKTMWRDDRLFYQFEVEKYKNGKRKREWFLVFTDSHGFEILRHKPSETIEVVSDNNELVGFSATGNTFMKADDYRRLGHWNVNWVDK